MMAPENQRRDVEGKPVVTNKTSSTIMMETGPRAGPSEYPEYPHDTCVSELVARQAAATPDAVALVADGRTLTYRELNQRANQLAWRLRTLGVGPETLVGVCLERSFEMVVGLLGTLKAGAAYVPLDPAYPARRLTFMLEDAHAPVVVTRQSLTERIPTDAAQVVCLDSDSETLARQSLSDPAPTANASNLAYVIYTSGSTGQPKGVQITHDSLLNLMFWHQHAFAVTAADRATQLAGPAFDAVAWELWPHLTAGASVFLPDEETRVTPALLHEWLLAHQITISFVPTALAERLMTLEWPSGAALRFLLTGADTLHRYPPEGAPFALINNYGPTESTVVTTSGRILPTDHPSAAPPIGRPIANTQVYILDERLRQVPIGEPGELCIGGAGVSRGYLNRPDLTRERFIPNPYSDVVGARLYRTGDLARYLPDGQLAFMGRIDAQIKIRGYRIEPGEVVAALNRHPGIEASAVVAREDAEGEKLLVAYIAPRADATLTLSGVRGTLLARLPDFMVPAMFVPLQSLPLTPNGKLDHAALPAPSATNTLRDAIAADDTPSLTPIEERVTTIVAGLLHLDHVGLDDNFFMLGGHSMLGAQLIARLADTFNVELSLRTLFDSPTVRELSAEIEQRILTRLEALTEEDVQRLLT